ncbi:type II toxin-antitoxin system PemK/MazF family toxin [Pontibacillus salipaludis]|uniref:type II toxin-antitoxin system PemK/MazF family toxin n=1 Tax=Pontibacillus salipaludis TaxID=1697394 RepID=UPI0031F0FC10
MTFNSKDIVLVPFPFVDQNTSKKRPAIVLNIFTHTQQYNKLICAAITSKEKNPHHDRYEHQITKPLRTVYFTNNNGFFLIKFSL